MVEEKGPFEALARTLSHLSTCWSLFTSLEYGKNWKTHFYWDNLMIHRMPRQTQTLSRRHFLLLYLLSIGFSHPFFVDLPIVHDDDDDDDNNTHERKEKKNS